MSIRTLIVAALAMICGVAAALGVNQIIHQKPAATPTASAPEPATISVPVAAVNIQRGTEITDDMVQMIQWPKDMVPDTMLTERDKLIGRITHSNLVAGEPIFEGNLGGSNRVSAMVPEGMRAYSIMTPNDASLVAGLIVPGDKVDVLFTDKNNNRAITGGGSTTPLLQNIEVLAMGKALDPDETRGKSSNDMRSVTLIVRPEMATKLALAQTTGTLHLSLRSEGDAHTASLNGVTLNELNQTAYPALLGDAAVADSAVAPVTPAADAAMNQARDQVVIRTMRGAIPSRVVMEVPRSQRGVYIAELPE